MRDFNYKNATIYLAEHETQSDMSREAVVSMHRTGSRRLILMDSSTLYISLALLNALLNMYI